MGSRAVKIDFLIQNFFGMGGTNVAVAHLAEELANTHEVRVVSVMRRSNSPAIRLSSRVKILSLIDLRGGRPDSFSEYRTRPSVLVPPSEEYYRQYSELSDQRIVEYLRTTTANVVIGTRPSLNLLLAEYGLPRYLRFAQEHMTQDLIPPGVAAAMEASYGNLDASICLTAADRLKLASRVPIDVLTIPNAVPKPISPGSSLDLPILMAAGRLVPGKRYSEMIEAFAAARSMSPGWQLRIYGEGPLRNALRRQAALLGVDSQVLFMGQVTPLGPEWGKAAICCSSSEFESFGMTLVEAMRSGVPVVSSDCPVGPREIVTDQSGILVPVGDIDAMAKAMQRLMIDDQMRLTMGRNAAVAGERFSPKTVGDQYLRLLERTSLRLPKSTRLGAAARGAYLGLAFPIRHRIAHPRPTITVFCESYSRLTFTLRASSPVRRLVLHERGGQRPDVLLAPCRDESGGTVFSLSDDVSLPHGRWDVLIESFTGTSRATAGTIDSRMLVRTARPTPIVAPLVTRIPYRTHDGNLSLQVCNLDAHAECFEAHQDDRTLMVAGYLVGGPRDGRTANLIAVRRPPSKMRVTFPATISDSWFEAVVDLDDLVSRRVGHRDNWDLYLRHGDDDVRIGRLLTDVADRKRVLSLPALEWPHIDESPLIEEFPATHPTARVFYTDSGFLSVYVDDTSR